MLSTRATYLRLGIPAFRFGSLHMKKGKSDLERQAILEDIASVLAVCAAKPGRHYGDFLWIAHDSLTRCTFIGSNRAGSANSKTPPELGRRSLFK